MVTVTGLSERWLVPMFFYAMVNAAEDNGDDHKIVKQRSKSTALSLSLLTLHLLMVTDTDQAVPVFCIAISNAFSANGDFHRTVRKISCVRIPLCNS